MTPKTLLVTCGATVPFPRLVECILGENCVEALLENGFKRMIVQFGRGYQTPFTKLVGKGISNDPIHLSSDLGYEEKPIHGYLASGQFEIIGIEYSTKILHLIEECADLVISHAGTGSILDSLRLQKPLIVCVNDTLMDNHQQQIADKFKSANYLLACLPKEDELVQCLHRSQKVRLSPFPQAFNKFFEENLMSLAYGPATSRS